MKKKTKYFKVICLLFVCILACMITGCANHSTEEKPPAESGNSVESENEISADIETVEADWSEYFNGRNGTAVIYDPSNRRYTVYNQKLAETRSSPCSTFKIISSLIALENGIILPEDSTRTWSGERFWNEDWNKDIDFREAFRTSCVWYFRQVIDNIGKDRMQKELEKLQYGNCDISDWEGSLNTNNNNRALTGFWIESSLRISPKEQTAVMERIFGGNSDYSEETRNQLKQVILVPEQDRADFPYMEKPGWEKPMVLSLTHGSQALRKVQKVLSIFACVLERQRNWRYPARWQKK